MTITSPHRKGFLPKIGTSRFKVVSSGMLLLAMAACTRADASPTPGISLLPTPPHLESQTVDRVFAEAGSYLQIAGDSEVVTFHCTVVEGTFCWFGDSSQLGSLAGDLARIVIDQVSPDAIENANRNEVMIQCARPTAGGAPICEIDYGWGAGWETLAID